MIAYYLFQERAVAMVAWITLLVIFNMVGVVGPFFAGWRTPGFRVWRTAAYVGCGAVCVGPVVQYYLEGGELPPMGEYLWMISMYLGGVAVYVLRIPER